MPCSRQRLCAAAAGVMDIDSILFLLFGALRLRRWLLDIADTGSIALPRWCVNIISFADIISAFLSCLLPLAATETPSLWRLIWQSLIARPFNGHISYGLLRHLFFRQQLDVISASLIFFALFHWWQRGRRFYRYWLPAMISRCHLLEEIDYEMPFFTSLPFSLPTPHRRSTTCFISPRRHATAYRMTTTFISRLPFCRYVDKLGYRHQR